MILKKISIFLLATACAVVTTQCKNAGTNGQEFSGMLRDPLTQLHEVSVIAWKITNPGVGVCTRTLYDFKNSDGYAVYSESGSACSNPDKFGKSFFTNDAAGTLWYCDSIAGKSTADEVKAVTAVADATSPATTGCNGKAWTKLTSGTGLTLAGNFTDNFSSTHTIQETSWDDTFCVKTIIHYDNTNGYLVYQEESSGCFNRYKFGKIFWTVDSARKLYYCELLYNQSSYLATANSATKPTYTSPGTTGCSGFSWTNLTRK